MKNMNDFQKSVVDPVFPILKEGAPFILIPLIVGIAIIVIPRVFCIEYCRPVIILQIITGLVLIIFALFCTFFFRNPKIKITNGENVVLSPCNGTVLEIEETENEKIIRTFLSIFNVHLQRSPVSGIVKSVEHKDGKYFAAWNPNAHKLNEQNIITIESDAGTFIVRQIAGFLARRCVSRVKDGDLLKAGNMIGLIKFSSQVDLHLPKNIEIKVKQGDKVRAGITIMGELKN